MRFRRDKAEFFVPDGRPSHEALERTTHMGVCAHQDDLEIMAYHGILECYMSEDNWFLGVTVTDGRGSPREGLYAKYSEEEVWEIRRREQRKAAVVGEYSGVIFLDYPSAILKDPKSRDIIIDLKEIISRARPKTIYTHNLADKHESHVAVAIRTIQALRELPEEARPLRIYGCEVWRDLDWLVDGDKVMLDVSSRENLALALLGVYDSQILGGKRYHLSTIGRRWAQSTFRDPSKMDVISAATIAMDLTPLIEDPRLDIVEYVMRYIERFREDVSDRLARLL